MTVDVVVVGGGPTGLMLGAELALRGVSVVIVERSAQATTSARANGLVGQVVRIMDQRGLYRDLSTAGRRDLPALARLGLLPQRSHPVPAARYQYGGYELALRSLTPNLLYVLPVAQRRLESILERRCRERGVEVRRGHELTGLDADATSVEASITGPAGPYRLRASYLVGCDGAHSAVRKLAGIDFPGATSTECVSRSALVRIPRAELSTLSGELTLPNGRLRPYQFHRTDSGAFSFAPRPGGLHVVNTYEWRASERGRAEPGSVEAEDDGPVTQTEIEASLRRVLGTDLGARPPDTVAEPLRRRTTARNTRMADRYRDGRVFIAGDAAHVFTGFGGPGLNLGLTDVVNLGWKLAAAACGTAPAGLLDSYQSERQPQATQVLQQTLEQTALLAPGDASDALRREFSTRIEQSAGLREVVDVIAGCSVPYATPGTPPGPLAGRLAPDLPVHGKRGRIRLAVRQRTGRPLLLTGPVAGPLDALAGGRVDLVRAARAGRPLLIRPDGFVAWVGTDDGQPAGLGEALDAWFA